MVQEELSVDVKNRGSAILLKRRTGNDTTFFFLFTCLDFDSHPPYNPSLLILSLSL